ncbi:hypothetical protein EW146_g9657 [Bondarzewia mesenterica]|uniref:Uncharacterized protein n=1 Tax=Bondarzewia mesenterica TaxID=1095465 RepID=A0A4S4L4E3_9AGAM|nr:hypothetical protein EW146_g9657 [Bondarzewia mesenterica]
MSFLPPVRIVLYCLLLQSARESARIHYTTHLAPRDPLNHGRSFYGQYPIVAELLATTILTMFWTPYIIHAIAKRRDYGLVYTFTGELLGNAVLFLLWIVGAGISHCGGNSDGANNTNLAAFFLLS